MTVYILGFESPRGYEITTSVQLAEDGDFVFLKSLKGIRPNPTDSLIRYGKTGYSSKDARFRRVFNKGAIIKQQLNKLRTLRTLNHANIRIPRFWIHPENITRYDFPVLRRLQHHSRGRDIRICNTADEARRFVTNESFFVKLIQSSSEFRVHVFNNVCTRLSKKRRIEDFEDTQRSDIIRSSNKGWGLGDIFTHHSTTERNTIEAGINAVGSIGLDFGAADIVIENNTNIPYVLEVNSAPRLGKYGREVFVKEVREALNLSMEGIKAGLIKSWEFNNSIPIKYRRAYHTKEDRITNTRGLH